MDGHAWTNGRIQPLRDATVPLLDRGHLLGDGVFETIRVSGGQPFRLPAHMHRMRSGLTDMGLESAFADQAAEAVEALIAHHETGPDLYVRVQVTSGTGAEIAGEGDVHVSAIARRFRPYPMRHYQRGIRLVTSYHRKDSRDPLAGVKSLSFANHTTARRSAIAKGAHDAILVNEHDRVAEATTSNVFAILGDQIHAPGRTEGGLDGVTRTAVLELVDDVGYAVQDALTLEQMALADEVWLTNTIGGVVPATQWNGAPIGSGEPGPLGRRMGAALEAMVRGA